MKLSVYLWLILSIVGFVCGEYFSKKYVGDRSVYNLLAVMVSYTLGGLLWLPALCTTNKLVVTGVIWTSLSLVATIVVGLYLGETIGFRQWVGIVLAFSAVIILSA